MCQSSNSFKISEFSKDSLFMLFCIKGTANLHRRYRLSILRGRADIDHGVPRLWRTNHHYNSLCNAAVAPRSRRWSLFSSHRRYYRKVRVQALALDIERQRSLYSPPLLAVAVTGGIYYGEGSTVVPSSPYERWSKIAKPYHLYCLRRHSTDVCAPPVKGMFN
jgi:hypothetical protein